MPEGKLLDTMAAAFPFVMRLGTGGFASGYSTGLKEDDGAYGVVKVAGRRVSELLRGLVVGGSMGAGASSAESQTLVKLV